MKFLRLSLSACVLACLAATAAAEPGSAYLKPDLRIGERLSSVFSKTMAITGTQFKDVVGRTSGTGEEVVTAIDGNEITFRTVARYDGHPVQQGIDKRLKDGITECWNGQCAINDETSGTLFNPYLWGQVPQDIHAGATWTAVIAKPWEIGPPGTERVRVLRLDPINHEITLTREGSGNGASSDDAHRHEITITTKAGKKLRVTVVPGESHWSGYTTIRRGLIIGDEILLQRHVMLVAKTGERFKGNERIYTLENAATGLP